MENKNNWSADTVKAVNDIIADESLSWEARYEKIVSYLKENEGLISARPIIMPTMDCPPDAEAVAKDMCMFLRAEANGELKEVAIDEL